MDKLIDIHLNKGYNRVAMGNVAYIDLVWDSNTVYRMPFYENQPKKEIIEMLENAIQELYNT